MVRKNKKPDQNAPVFELADKSGKVRSLKEIAGEYTVLYFYPKDDTPGCTLEAQEFSALLPKFKRKKIAVVGISGGDSKSKQKFCSKHDLSVLLLSDPTFEVSKAYDAYGKKKFMGREFNGIFRKTFILDKKLKIIKVFENVSAKGHAQEVLEYCAK